MAANSFIYILIIATAIVCFSEVKSLLFPSNKIEASEAPFMVYVRNIRQYCGGVILSESIVLTASHCIVEGSMTVTAGQTYRYSRNHAQKVDVEKKLPHKEYLLDPNGIQAYNDIGLLLLQTPFTFNEYVQPIELTNETNFHGLAEIIGWGSTDAFENYPSEQLRAKNISLIPDDLCVSLLDKAITKCTKQVYEICAEKGTCSGDSGGPLVQKVGNVTKLIGITSWGADDNINCDNTPAVFENVGYFSRWIKDGMSALLAGRNSTDNRPYIRNDAVTFPTSD